MNRAMARTLDGKAAHLVESVVRYDGEWVWVQTSHGCYWAHRAYVTIVSDYPTEVPDGGASVILDPAGMTREQEREVAEWLVRAGAGALVMREPFDYDGPGSVVEVRAFCTIDQDGVPCCRSGAVACGEPVGDEPNCVRVIEVTPGPPPQFIADRIRQELPPDSPMLAAPRVYLRDGERLLALAELRAAVDKLIDKPTPDWNVAL